MVDVKTTKKGLVFKVYVQPGASADQVSGCRGDALKIRVTAPPADGKANKACIKLLAGKIGIAKSQMEIISGSSGRDKKILVSLRDSGGRGKSPEDIKKLVESLSDKKGS
ncbi:MAG: DUF167 domain-containing protein [Thermodesulfobacteriota bacterium]